LIVPDLPPEEGAALEGSAKKAGLDVIYLLAPTSTEERIKLVARKSSGYIYLVSVAGVTGARQALPPDLSEFIARVRRFTPLPLCVGFGISTPRQAGLVAAAADGVIIGSKFIQLMQSDPSLNDLSAFAHDCRQAIDQKA
jgi:tryptophan synthase alpha chain